MYILQVLYLYQNLLPIMGTQHIFLHQSVVDSVNSLTLLTSVRLHVYIMMVMCCSVEHLYQGDTHELRTLPLYMQDPFVCSKLLNKFVHIQLSILNSKFV